jgi:hypothetical protein
MVRKRNKTNSADLPVAAPCEGVPEDVGISGGVSASGLAPHEAPYNAEQRKTVSEKKDAHSSWADMHSDSQCNDNDEGDDDDEAPCADLAKFVAKE